MKDDVTETLRATAQILDRFLAQYEPLRETPWTVPPGSPLAGDDAKTDPYQVSHSAQHAIQAAIVATRSRSSTSTSTCPAS
ncbi:hypothetical protein ABTY61_22540 [Kitasatospora sp. NPDC096128]|uniref:hypothetical protein n=1 Tax=Kitasatospora sp. NPDC096128 TaxID=3155547 RepID=UPI003319D243